MTHSNRLALTLVHGTFAPKAAWIAPGSVLRNYLAQTLGSETEFSAFRWTGWNTQDARLKAASKLADDLESRIRARPETHHFVIAHSHGGNVVLYALSLLPQDCRQSVKGVISLATPFIRTSPRAVNEALSAIPMVLGILIALTLAIPGILLFPHDGWEVLSVSLLLLAVLSFVVTMVSRGDLTEQIESAVQSRQALLNREWTAHRSPGVPLLAITPDGDEALKGLRTFDHIGDAPFAVYAFLVRVLSSLFAVLRVIEPLTRIVTSIPMIGPLLQLVLSLPLLVFLALALAATGALGIVLILLFIIPWSRKVAYFDHSALDYLHSSVLVGRWPARRTEVPQPTLPGIQLAKGLLDLLGSELSPDDTLLDSDAQNGSLDSPPSHGSELITYPTSSSERLRVRLRLYHCDIYNRPRVLQRIQEWILTQAGSHLVNSGHPEDTEPLQAVPFRN